MTTFGPGATIRTSTADDSSPIHGGFTNRRKGSLSRWSGYLQSLPKREPPLAIFWNDVEDGEFVAALDCIRGTQLERRLTSRDAEAQLVCGSKQSLCFDFFGSFHLVGTHLAILRVVCQRNLSSHLAGVSTLIWPRELSGVLG